jgi:hypothetical protein
VSLIDVLVRLDNLLERLSIQATMPRTDVTPGTGRNSADNRQDPERQTGGCRARCHRVDTTCPPLAAQLEETPICWRTASGATRRNPGRKFFYRTVRGKPNC